MISSSMMAHNSNSIKKGESVNQEVTQYREQACRQCRRVNTMLADSVN